MSKPLFPLLEMRTLLYIALLLGLTQCLNPNPHTKRNLNRYFFLIDTLEDKHPAWLTDHIFIDFFVWGSENIPDTNHVWAHCFIFYKNNTFSAGASGFKVEHANQMTNEEITSILDSIKKREIKSIAFFNKFDSVAQLKEIGGIYVVHNDTIKTHSYGAYGSSPLFSGDYPITGGVLSINQKEKCIEQVKFGIYPKTVAKNIEWGEVYKRRKHKGYPVTFLDSLPPLPLSQWPPFRRWKARLDSINAGLRPPEKSR